MSIASLAHAPRFGWVAVWIAVGVATGAAPSSRKTAEPGNVALGRDLFLRKWIPNDPKSHGGDGLGPMYNEMSCVACHSLGGTGGAGPRDKNVLLVTATPNTRGRAHPRTGASHQHRTTSGGAHHASGPNINDRLIQYHAGFRDTSTVVLHRYGTMEGYADRRATIVHDLRPTSGLKFPLDRDLLLGNPTVQSLRLAAALFDASTEVAQLSSEVRQLETHSLTGSERNTPALFGAGVIDAIPSGLLTAVAARQDPKVRGRLHWLTGRTTGRFGWKGQVSSLREFVYTACANELGLEVPGHHQAGTPDGPVIPRGLDLNHDECEALVAYVASLPVPSRAPGWKHDPDVTEGERLFQEVGCAVCHTPSVGSVHGLYSDLLIHDMGPELASSGVSYGTIAASSDPKPLKPTEWRTPPLWGFHESGPYLHDGRAEDLDSAVRFHKGQAEESCTRYQNLSADDRRKIQSFLDSLVAPPASESGAVGAGA